MGKNKRKPLLRRRGFFIEFCLANKIFGIFFSCSYILSNTVHRVGIPRNIVEHEVHIENIHKGLVTDTRS